MTKEGLIRKNIINNSSVCSALCLCLAVIMIFFNSNIKSGVLLGLYYSFTTIIPTLFPFFILSDIWSSLFTVKNDGVFAKTFERLFGINSFGISSLVSGLVCGFPIGVKVALELYQAKKISKDEFERLSGFANNPSAAFIISGVGAGIIGDVKYGILLYISIILSSIVTGVVFRKKASSSTNPIVISRQTFNLVNSIKNAAMNSISVTSFIIFFFGITSILQSVITNPLLLCIISSFLEVSGATKMAFACRSVNLTFRIILIAFSLGFSGISVHMQAMMFFEQNRLPKKYLLMKLCQGILAAIFTYISLQFLNFSYK